MASLRDPRRRYPDVYQPPAASPEEMGARLAVLGVGIGVLLLLLVGRLWYLQVLRGPEFREAASANNTQEVRVAAPRGVIEDRSGKVLVTNRAQFTVSVTPADLPVEPAERRAVLTQLAQLLELPIEELTAQLPPPPPPGAVPVTGGAKRRRAAPAAADGKDVVPVPVASGVTMRVVSRIAENRVRLPGVSAQAEPIRHYPQGRLAAHALGSIGQITPNELEAKANAALGYAPGDFIGKTGVERTYDKFLAGREGAALFEVDARGRRQRELGTRAPTAGDTIRLCLDATVQRAAERALGARHGAAVALDPRDGRVIALTSSPTYDPNVFARRPLKASVWKALNDPASNFPLQNRAIASPQPPGSTFKIVTAAAGLATGAITIATGDYCTGGIPLGSRIKRCHSVHGHTNVISALAASCDVFFYHAGFRIEPTPLAQWAGHFGLGAKTGIDLTTEVAGTVPSPAWKAAMAPKFGNPDTGWYQGDTANMAIGQGDVLATPLQMALVAAGIANNGVICRPQVVDQVIGADKRIRYKRKPEVLRRLPLAPDQIRRIAEGMRAVVAGARGTSRGASLPGIAVAGKSGSAETRGGGPTHAWFIAYAPVENPTIAVCVFLETRGASLHGGSDAAPVARRIMAAHFGLEVDGKKVTK